MSRLSNFWEHLQPFLRFDRSANWKAEVKVTCATESKTCKFAILMNVKLRLPHTNRPQDDT